MVTTFVPAGEFTMGSTPAEVGYAVQLCNQFVSNCQPEWFEDEQPAHMVSLSPFWIDKTEVTNAQFASCVAAGACRPPAANGSRTRPAYYNDAAFADFPVIDVGGADAAAYCAWAGARLPTEAEWEYAARGPENRRYPWGNDFDGQRLNYCDANCGEPWQDPGANDGAADTARVGSYPAGASWCGALDLAGNVWEWASDWKGPYPAGPVVNPAGPPSGEVRVVRGGSWDHEPCDARSAYRTWFSADEQYGEWDITPGFRCAVGAT